MFIDKEMATVNDIGKICLFWKRNNKDYAIGTLGAITTNFCGTRYVRVIGNNIEDEYPCCSVMTVEQFKDRQAHPRKYLKERR